ncbi:MAG: ATP-grasp domain-containing protein [Sphingomonadales bacterium]|nr:ATP-grasp domain-containing protein [Sphingomonadales bacterium]
MTIRRILIANRGEIAVRIIRTAQKLGIETVLAVSEADRGSLGAQIATRALCIGPARPSDSYLRVETIVQAALGSGCDAIHPGYGFLSERAALAQMCEDEEIGAPILVKAVGGGGGRGMKLVEDLRDLPATMDMASAEAGAAFGDARVYLERYVAQGRHVEVQVLGDGAGKVIHLGERDCSVQRRYQKLIEETPAPHLPEDIRAQMHEAAVRFAARLDYRGAGTVEFLYDVARNQFYFLEMNARIQVEHPVTEMVTGVDLIAEQIAIANGEGLRFEQSDICIAGAAIECRINAENPARDFMPSPGTVTTARWPTGEGVRVDTHIVDGAKIPPFYDSMVAKIIAHGPDRATALSRLKRALSETAIEGVSTNIAFQAESLADPDFARGGVDTGFLARRAGK